MAEIPDSESLEPLSSSSVSARGRGHSADTDLESLSDSDIDYQPRFQDHRSSDSPVSLVISSPLPARNFSETDDNDEDVDDDEDFGLGRVGELGFPGGYFGHGDPYFEGDEDEELTDVSSDHAGDAAFRMPDIIDPFDEDGLFVDDFDYGVNGPADPAPPEINGRENVRGVWRALAPENNFGALQAFRFRMEPVERPGRQRDELVQMEMGGNGNGNGNGDGNGRNHRQNRQQHPPTVIDLTGDDAESSPRPAYLRAPRHPSQNPRGRRSQRRSTPPPLARSDGSYIGGPQVINLISDSDDELDEVPPPRRSNNNSNDNININDHNNAGRGARNARLGDMPRQAGRAGAQNAALRDAMNVPLQHFHQIIANIPIFHMMNRNNPADRDPDDDIVMLGQRNLPAPPPPPAHGNIGPVHLDYLAVPFGPPHYGGAVASPKPAHEPPKEAREGFTRETGEDVVAICPSCEKELAYDPDGEDDAPLTPAKKQRTKKDKAEHHFWAVKACGHVYCKKCFDNRKPVGKNPTPVGFRPDPKGTKNKMLCAVDECDSDVSSKTAWVGIFL
ncbi:hypothetical protein F5X99DRAFT_407108 [Biscogniauxia marginata]|nr:hypothetical protein F5X99DRAFT_407108 [Biscogniauxia marginata]